MTAIAAAVLALSATVPAPATTFPCLTLIYVASGAIDTGTTNGNATSVVCSNAIGPAATVRIIFYYTNGGTGPITTNPVQPGQTYVVSTQYVAAFANEISAATGSINSGKVGIYSTQSGVFCTAMAMDAAASAPSGIDLHMVRFNAHPGTVE